MDLELSSKRVLVIGGSGHIGLAVARRFIAEGADVVLAARTERALDRSVAAISGTPVPDGSARWR